MKTWTEEELSKMERISQREFGRRLDVSEKTVRDAIKAGWIIQGRFISESGRPGIIYEIAVEEWNASPAALDKKRPPIVAPSEKKGKQPQEQKEVVAPGNKAATLFDAQTAEVRKEIMDNKADREKTENEIKRIELEKLRNSLISKEATYKSLFEYGKAIRENLVIIPDRCIDQIRGAATRHEAHEILSKEIIEALRLLSSPPDIITAR